MIDTKRLRTLADRDRSMTHWVGCEYDHIGCAIVAACREIEALRAAFSAVAEEIANDEVDNHDR